MKRKLTLMLALLFVWIGVAWSQGVTVKGVVTSEEDGLPIVGASVLVKGTTQGTITDVDGNFMISGHCCPEKFYHSVSCLGPLPSGTLAVRSV